MQKISLTSSIIILKGSWVVTGVKEVDLDGGEVTVVSTMILLPVGTEVAVCALPLLTISLVL